jgi:photosystem II stability/assembly factor-like uncharacterized protein
VPGPSIHRLLVALQPALAILLVASIDTPAQSQTLPPGTSMNDVRMVERAYPRLIEYSTRPGGLVISGADPAALETLLDQLAGGEFTPEMNAAVRLLVQGMSQRTGAVGALGRNLMQDIAGAAATGGGTAAVRGVSGLLFDVMEDLANPYSILAQDLLSEKMRCGAAAAGDDALVREIAERTSPDREFAFLSRTDGTIADRYGLHDQADLYTVVARGKRVIATGHFGTVVVSRDGGASFRTPDTGTDEPLYAAAFGPGEDVWVVGRHGAVLHSTDGGESFARRSTPFDRHFFGVSVLGSGDVLVVGDFGLQLVRDAQADLWRCVPRNEDIILGRIVPAGPDRALVAEFGTLERLPGGRLPGRRGKLSGVPEDVYLFDLWFDATGQVGIAVGLSGTVMRSEDGGASWAPVVAGLDADLYGVGGAGDRVVVVGKRGVIAISDDRGRSFEQRTVPGLRLPFHDVALADPENGYLVGPRGLIVALRGGGERFEIVRGPGAKTAAPAEVADRSAP